MGAAILPLLGIASRTTSEKGRGRIPRVSLEDFAGFAMFASEGPEFAFDYLLGDGGDICQLSSTISRISALISLSVTPHFGSTWMLATSG